MLYVTVEARDYEVFKSTKSFYQYINIRNRKNMQCRLLIDKKNYINRNCFIVVLFLQLTTHFFFM